MSTSPRASADRVIPPDTFLRAVRYDATYALTAFPVMLAFSVRAEGSRHVPLRGPALLIANHQSYFDPLLVGFASRRRLCYLARTTLYRNPVLAWLIRGLNAVPIYRSVGKEGLTVALDMLTAGRAVLVFPEGERTHDGHMQPLKPGVQLLVQRGGAPVIPVGIAGAYDAWSRWRSYPRPAPLFLPPRRGSIAVSIGQALPASKLAPMPRQQLLDTLFHELRVVAERAERLRRK